MGGTGSGRRTKSPAELIRTFEKQKGKGSFARFDALMRDPTTTLQDVADKFGITSEWVRKLYKRIKGNVDYGTLAVRKTTFNRITRDYRRREARTSIHALAIALACEEFTRKGFKITAPWSKEHGARKRFGFFLVKRTRVFIVGSANPRATVKNKSKRRYFFFKVPLFTQLKPWDVLVAVAILQSRDKIRTQFYIVPRDALKDKVTFNIPLFRLPPGEKGTPYTEQYRPGWTGRYSYDKFRDAWNYIQ